MPIPSKKREEKPNDFMSRCMGDDVMASDEVANVGQPLSGDVKPALPQQRVGDMTRAAEGKEAKHKPQLLSWRDALQDHANVRSREVEPRDEK